MFCMWLGERITDKGIGNGISMLIMIGIVSRFPVAILQEVESNRWRGQHFHVASASRLLCSAARIDRDREHIDE